jgi:DNA-binding transcriptional ArsR family regulator
MGEYATPDLNQVFGAMADPTRRAILARLSRGPARVTELADDFPISLNSTSKHIRTLEKAGLVRREVVGRDHFLNLEAVHLQAAAELLESYRPFWEDRLAALERFISAKSAKSGKSTKSAISTKRGSARAKKEKR